MIKVLIHVKLYNHEQQRRTNWHKLKLAQWRLENEGSSVFLFPHEGPEYNNSYGGKSVPKTSLHFKENKTGDAKACLLPRKN